MYILPYSIKIYSNYTQYNCKIRKMSPVNVRLLNSFKINQVH